VFGVLGLAGVGVRHLVAQDRARRTVR
jgi:hypothetical protein